MLRETKIKILSSLQQNVLLQASKISSELTTLEQMIDGDDASQTLKDFLTNQFESSEEMSSTDANVTYFVSGYIGRSIT